MRRAKTQPQRALARLKTIAWIHGVRYAAVISDGLRHDISFTGLEKALVRKDEERFGRLYDSNRIRNYARGKPAPTPATLAQFEEVYPGTREIFDDGPDGSRLWRALSCPNVKTAGALLAELKYEIQQGVRAEKRALRRRGTKRPRPGIAEVLIPAPLAHTLGLSDDAALDYRNAQLKRRLERNPRLADSLSDFLGGEDPVRVDGPLVALTPDVTFSRVARQAKNLIVRPPLLTGLAMQILQAHIDNGAGVALGYWRRTFIVWRLLDFGLSADAVERVSGLRFRTAALRLTRTPRRHRRAAVEP